MGNDTIENTWKLHFHIQTLDTYTINIQLYTPNSMVYFPTVVVGVFTHIYIYVCVVCCFLFCHRRSIYCFLVCMVCVLCFFHHSIGFVCAFLVCWLWFGCWAVMSAALPKTNKPNKKYQHPTDAHLHRRHNTTKLTSKS